MVMGKPPKKKLIIERAHQYRVIADRLQFHLSRDNLPEDVADLVRTAQQALANAAQSMESRPGETK